jgi:hypothetical protein
VTFAFGGGPTAIAFGGGPAANMTFAFGGGPMAIAFGGLPEAFACGGIPGGGTKEAPERVMPVMDMVCERAGESKRSDKL